MESDSPRARKKKSLLSIGALMLSLAALQSPLWRGQPAAPITVRTGGATLIESQHPIATVAVDQAPQASAEVVGDHEVLIRGKALGEANLMISTRDGRNNIYRIVIQGESARSGWRSQTVP